MILAADLNMPREEATNYCENLGFKLALPSTNQAHTRQTNSSSAELDYIASTNLILHTQNTNIKLGSDHYLLTTSIDLNSFITT